METNETMKGQAGFSPESAKIISALLGIQAKLKSIPRMTKNPFFNSTYADLATIMDTVRPLLTEFKVAVVQIPNSSARKHVSDTDKAGKTTTHETAEVELTTYLMHESGQYICGTLTMEARDAGPQSIGSAVTYARRYGLISLLGVVSEGEDDDGNRGQGRETEGRGRGRGLPEEAKKGIARSVSEQWSKLITPKVAEEPRRAKCIAAFLAEHYDGVALFADLLDEDLLRLRDYFKKGTKEKLDAILAWSEAWDKAHPSDKPKDQEKPKDQKPEAQSGAGTGEGKSGTETAPALTPDERNAVYEKIAVGFRDLVLSVHADWADTRIAHAAQAFTKELYKVDTLAGVPDNRLLILAATLGKDGSKKNQEYILDKVKAWSEANPPKPETNPLDEALGLTEQEEISKGWLSLRANCAKKTVENYEKNALKYKDDPAKMLEFLQAAIIGEQEKAKKEKREWKT